MQDRDRGEQNVPSKHNGSRAFVQDDFGRGGDVNLQVLYARDKKWHRRHTGEAGVHVDVPAVRGRCDGCAEVVVDCFSDVAGR